MTKPIIVTGGAGFIGSNIIEGLNTKGISNIIVVDNLTNAKKFKNIVDLKIIDFIDKQDFINLIINKPNLFENIEAIFHQGACSDTMEHDGHYMMKNNFEYSKILFQHCQKFNIPFIYASSAATYGNDISFIESPEFETPLNIYGYSKLLFDNYVRKYLPNSTSQVVGFRYFNVYGPREFHKGKMASVALHHFLQYKANKQVKLFGEYAGYQAGSHTRDFIYVKDVVKLNLYMLENPHIKGIYNLGTGNSEPFNNIALAMLNACRIDIDKYSDYLNLSQLVEKKYLEYIDFPQSLQGKYQSYTQASLANLVTAYDIYKKGDFLTVAQGIKLYYEWLKDNYSRFEE